MKKGRAQNGGTEKRGRVMKKRGRVQFPISEQLLSRNVERFRGGLVFKAHRLLYYSTLGTRVIKKKKNLPPAKSAHTEKKGV